MKTFEAIEPVLIRSNREDHGWMGNMAPFSVVHEGETFRTTEALFQCLRLPKGHPARALIMAENSPMSAKMVAKKHVADFVVEPLSKEDLKNMAFCLDLKLKCNPGLIPFLQGTGDRPIVEDCTRRQHGSGLFWGAALQDGILWKGENWLGTLWARAREKSRE